jgi:hypothetical protein
MKIDVTRFSHTDTTTLGRLAIEGQFECYTLEDMVRPPGLRKVWGRTAIPPGRYEVALTYSTRFHEHMPELLDVPNYKGIRIHSGNTAADTAGCLLTGTAIAPNRERIFNSWRAYHTLLLKLEAALDRGEDIWLTIG